jgi:hypothetical protein
MKKRILFSFIAILSINVLVSQAKKPTIMIVPSDIWCNLNGFMSEFDNQGTIVKIPDYKLAFQENSDLLLVLNMINGLMAERGFPLKNLESIMKSLEFNSAEDVLLSSENGSYASESGVDKIRKVAKADIILQITWVINKLGPKRSITFNLQGIDAYTNKQIASASGTGASSFSAALPVLLEEAVLSHIDNFNASLISHFDDLFANGREVIIRIKKWDDWEENLETEFGPNNEELGIIIEDWMAEYTVNSRFNTTDATENMMLFEQVRIPLYYEKNGKQRAMDTRRFASNLSNFLKNAPYNIVNKVTTNGLGIATIYLGSK